MVAWLKLVTVCECFLSTSAFGTFLAELFILLLTSKKKIPRQHFQMVRVCFLTIIHNGWSQSVFCIVRMHNKTS